MEFKRPFPVKCSDRKRPLPVKSSDRSYQSKELDPRSTLLDHEDKIRFKYQDLRDQNNLWKMIHETTSKTDSNLVCNPFDASDLWKPMKEYQNITIKCKGNIDKHILCSNNSALASEDEEKLCHDPIGSHIIDLRRYYLYLDQQLKELSAKKKAVEKSERTKKRKVEHHYFTIPKFPPKYPFSRPVDATSQDSGKRIIRCRGEIPKHLVEEERMIFIKSVLEQTGVYGIEDENVVLKYLSGILDDFLQKFANLLSHNKNSEPFSGDKELWSPLETTLRNFGMGGISALHVFYYENVVKKHDILFEKCMDMYNQLQKH